MLFANFFNIITIVIDTYLWYTLLTYIYIYNLWSSMTRKSLLKIAILGTFIIFLMALLALPIEKTQPIATSLRLNGGTLAPEIIEDFSSTSRLSPRSLIRQEDSYSFDTTYSEWQQKQLLTDNNALYFGYTGEDSPYSALATITTPELVLADNSYTLFVDYFSSREKDFPNFLTVYSSIMGEKFIKLHTEKVFYTDNTYKTLSAKLPLGTKYIKLEAKVYADDGRTESGIYIDNIGIASHNSPFDALNSDNFSLSIPAVDIFYDGAAKMPNYTLSYEGTTVEYFSYPYITTSDNEETTFSKGISAIDAGTYYLHIAIFSIKNEYVCTKTIPFTIKKSDLRLDMTKLIYNVYTDYIVIHNIPLYNSNNLLIAPENGENVSYLVNEVSTQTNIPCVKVPTSGAFNFAISIAESNNYNQVNSETISVGETRFVGNYLFFETEQNMIYDGTVQGIDYFFFTIPVDGNGDDDLENITPFEYTEEDFAVTYRLNGELAEPRDVGKYLATVTYKTFVVSVNFEITKRTLTNANYIGYNLNKSYDGSTVLYYTRKENIEDTATVSSASATLKSHDFDVADIMDGDEVFLVVGSAKYNFNLGNVKVVIDNLSLSGAQGQNYQLDTNFVTTWHMENYTISPTTLYLAPQSGGNTLLIKSKTYDGTLKAEIDFDTLDTLYTNRNLAPISFYGFSGSDKFDINTLEVEVDINTLEVEFVNKYAGSREVKLWHNDVTLLDRYNADINLSALTSPLTGTITPIALDINKDSSIISIADKTYSGNNLADVSFTSCVFDTPLTVDQAIINNNDNYKLLFESATFAQAGAGTNIEVTVKNIRLAVINTEHSDIIGSYFVNNLTLNKDIKEKELFLVTEYLRINSGSLIPELIVEPRGISIASTYYNSLLDAQNDTNRLPSDPSTSGTYFIRVTCSDNNYYLDGNYAVVKLVIATQKTDQTIVFDYDESYISENAITMLKGGKLVPSAYSVSDSGERTNLTLSYSINGEQSLFDFNNQTKTLTALSAGTVNIIATQAGDAFYNVASASIAVNIVDYDISLSEVVAPTAYVAEKLPTLSGNAVVNSTSVSSTFVPVDNLVETDKKEYTYRLTFGNTYVGYYDEVYTLSPTLMVLKITMPSQITRPYYQTTDFLDNIEKIGVERNGVITQQPKSVFSSFNLTFTMPTIADKAEIDFLPNTYTLNFLQGQSNYVSVSTTNNYIIEITNESLNLIVEKSEIVVKMPALTKYYGQDNVIPSINSVIFEGFFTESDLPTFKDSLHFIMTSDKLSPVGSYAINAFFDFKEKAEAINNCYNFTLLSSFMVVEPAPITITTTAPSSVYGADVAYYDTVINGLYLTTDYNYLKNYVNNSCTVSSKSNVATYTIFVDYFGKDNNYKVTVTNGIYSITPAPFTGIELKGKKVLYDGKKHSLTLSYDENIWKDIEISYNITDVSEVGVYNITATVKKQNYATTTYSETLTIATLNLASSSQTNKVEVFDLSEGSTGFSPDLTLYIKASQVDGITDKVKSMLQSLPTQQENIVAIYDITLLQDNTAVDTPDGSYRIKITIPNITTNSNIRILASIDNELKEVAHTFENGYFVFETDSLNGIAILKTTQITESRISAIVVVSIVGVVVIAMFGIIIGSFAGGRKATLRSRRKHHKWF